MAKCLHLRCGVEVAGNMQFCRVHSMAKGDQRRGGNIVDIAQSAKITGADLARVGGWCQDAKTLLERVLAEQAFQDVWVPRFFGTDPQHLEYTRRVFRQMPAVLERWRTGRSDIVKSPTLTFTQTPNCVKNLTAELTVSTTFLDGDGARKKWVLIHESSHGVTKLDRAINVQDHAYESSRDAFRRLTPRLRIVNADHYRYCVQLFAEAVYDRSAEALEKALDYAAPVAVVNNGGGNVNVGPLRPVEQADDYATYVMGGARSLIQQVWLAIWDVMSKMPDKFHKQSSLSAQDAKKLRKMTPGKKSSEIKNKDFLRSKELYNAAIRWRECLDNATFWHVHQPGMPVLEQGIRGGQMVFTLKSGYAVGNGPDPVAVLEPDLCRGVELVLGKMLERHPFNGIDVGTLFGLAKLRLGNQIRLPQYNWMRQY